LDKLNQLNCTKSPGPNAIHPRILYELREYIVYPLKLIFEESYKQKELPISDQLILQPCLRRDQKMMY